MTARRRATSELGLWSALYVAGVAFLAGQAIVGEARPAWGVEAYGFFVGLGVYLLDRVGVRRADPADGAPWPRGRRARAATRLGALGVLAGASVVGWFVRPALAAGPWIGLVVVAAYAWPGRWKLKRSVWLKGPVVAVCLVALGVLASGADRVLTVSAASWITAGGLVLFVLGDVVLSDLDDVEADRASGVGSVPAVAGERPARTLALGLHALGGAALLLGPDPRLTASAWSAGMVLSTWALVALRPARVRAIVDLRVPTLALAVWGLIEALGPA